jgi:recombination protein RecR
MSALSSLDRLVACLARLPGVGRRSAERMALRLVRDPDGLLRDTVAALQDAAASLRGCERCGSVTARERNPCRLCTDSTRDGAALCVVEDPNDIPKIEESGGFRGRYHALMGRLSPMKGTGPRDLRIEDLGQRIAAEGIREVILALNTDVESDATASYLAEWLRGRVKVTRLAYGLPAGSGIAYSDSVTLARAIQGRQEA